MSSGLARFGRRGWALLGSTWSGAHGQGKAGSGDGGSKGPPFFFVII